MDEIIEQYGKVVVGAIGVLIILAIIIAIFGDSLAPGIDKFLASKIG